MLLVCRDSVVLAEGVTSRVLILANPIQDPTLVNLFCHGCSPVLGMRDYTYLADSIFSSSERVH